MGKYTWRWGWYKVQRPNGSWTPVFLAHSIADARQTGTESSMRKYMKTGFAHYVTYSIHAKVKRVGTLTREEGDSIFMKFYRSAKEVSSGFKYRLILKPKTKRGRKSKAYHTSHDGNITHLW